MKMTVRDVIEGRLNDSVARVSCLYEDFDDGKLTKAQLIQKMREEIAEVMGKNFDFGFELGASLDEQALGDGGQSLLDFEVTEVNDDDEDDDVDDMDRPDFEG
jgi:hypothetical protein